MESLVQLAAGGRRRYILLRDDGTIDVEGMSDPLRQLRLDEEMIRLLGYDVDCRRYDEYIWNKTQRVENDANGQTVQSWIPDDERNVRNEDVPPHDHWLGREV